MSVVSGLISFTRIIDGDVVTSNLSSDKILIQRLKQGTSQPLPNWEVKENQPTISARVIAQSTGKRVTVSSPSWFYNGTKITSSDSRFLIGTSLDGSISIPTLKIVKNLANPDNLDTDNIKFEGIAKINGIDYEVRASIDIRLEEMVGEPYDGIIELTEGGVIDDNTSEVIATAVLYKGGSIVKDKVTYKWYKITETGQEIMNPNLGTPEKMKFTDKDVDSELTIKVDFYYDGVKVYSKTRLISDETDPFYLYVHVSNGQDLRDGESTTVTPVVYNRITQEKVSGYSFKYTELDNMLEVIGNKTGATYNMTAQFLAQNNNHVNLIINATV